MAKSYVAALALVLGACGTDGFFDTISPSAPGAYDAGCDNSTRGSVSSIDVGEMVADDMTFEQVYTPLDEGGMAMIVHGFQGADMLVLALRVSGAGTAPLCLDQKTDIEENGERISFNYVAKKFMPQPDGTLLGKTTYFPGAYTAGQVKINVSLGGKSLTRNVEVAP
jgi:hypothetical protein